MTNRFGNAGSAGDARDWSEIRRDYEAKLFSVDDVCLRHNISRGMLYRRRKRQGWPKRLQSTPSTKAASCKPNALLARLNKVISRRICGLESSELSDIRAETALESERQARAVSALVRALEQVVALQDRLRESHKKADDSDDADTVRWRADLAKALAGLAGPDADEVYASRGETGDGLGADGPAGPKAAAGG